MSCGTKFCLIPDNINNHTVYKSFNRLSRAIRIKKQFINFESNNNMYYLPNPGYVPKKASSCLETYIKSRYSDIKTRLKQVPYYNMRHNIAIKNILNNLTNDH